VRMYRSFRIWPHTGIAGRMDLPPRRMIQATRSSSDGVSCGDGRPNSIRPVHGNAMLVCDALERRSRWHTRLCRACALGRLRLAGALGRSLWPGDTGAVALRERGTALAATPPEIECQST
jgi:hypothetical protein